MTTSPRTFRLLRRVLVEGMPFLSAVSGICSDYGIGTPALVRSLCLNRLRTLLRTTVVTGNTGTPSWYIVVIASGLVRLTCYDQAHPISCAGAVAVQKVIAAENLLENGRQTGEYLGQLLRERLLSPNSLARPFTFDIRGGGSFWAVEFDFSGSEGKRGKFEPKQFAMLVQARCMENGLIVMGMPAGANLKDTEGGHIIFGPAYNITFKEVEKVVEVFVLSVEEVVRGW